MNDTQKRRHRSVAGKHPSSSAQGVLSKAIQCLLGAPKDEGEIPERKPSWEYIRFLERRQRDLHHQIILWFGISIFGIFAACAISTLATWPL